MLRIFFALSGTPVTVHRGSPVPSGRVIFAVNHASYLDGAVLTAAIPGPLSFVAKAELAGQFVAGTFLKRLGTVFVKRTDVGRSVEGATQIEELARSGERMVFFPEGTLTRMPGILEFHLGAFQVSARTGVPVVPVTIRGTRSVLRGDQWFPRRHAIEVHIGEPIEPEGDDFDAVLKLKNRVRQAIIERSGEPDLSEASVLLPDS